MGEMSVDRNVFGVLIPTSACRQRSFLYRPVMPTAKKTSVVILMWRFMVTTIGLSHGVRSVGVI